MAVPDKALHLITGEANQLLAMEQMKMDLIADGAAADEIKNAISSAWEWGGDLMSEIPKKFKDYFVDLFKAALPSWMLDDEEETTPNATPNGTTNGKTNGTSTDSASSPMGTPKQVAEAANSFYDTISKAAQWIKPNVDGFINAVTKKDNSPNPFYDKLMQVANGL